MIRFSHLALFSGVFFSFSVPVMSVFGNEAAVGAPGKSVIQFALDLPKREPVTLHQVRVLTRNNNPVDDSNQTSGNSLPGKENSGIVRSRQWPDLYWLHNDSGDEPRVYPIHANGEDYGNARYATSLGVYVAGAINVDWEDITVDQSGNLIVADVGNNRNDRRDLVLYVIPEPSPSAGRTAYLKRYFIKYPEQKEFPPSREYFDFDCEGIFTVDDTIYCFSKNRSNKLSTLYRLDAPKTDEVNSLQSVQTIDLAGQVVGADASAEGTRLVVITYTDVWVFERKSKDVSFFEGGVFWAPYQADQVEAVCFADAETLKMIDEATGILYDVKIADLTKIR